MSKTKVLFADHAPFIGGAQLRLAEDIIFLDKSNFEVSVVLGQDSFFSDIFQKTGVSIYKISFPKLKLISPVALTRLISSVREFKALIDKIKPDVVVANTTRTLVVAGLAKRLFSLQFKLISYMRDYDYPKWIFKLINKQVNKYLFVSRSVQDFYRLPGDVVYLGSSIETKYNQITKQQIDKLKDSLKIKEADFVIGYVGRLVDWKGPFFLLKSFAEIKNSKAKLIYWGTGDKQQGSVEEELISYFKKNKLEDRVIFAGHTSQPEIAYKIMNCFVLPSIKPEPFATSVIEASLLQVPIVATNIGGTTEFIRDNENGLLVSPDDTNQLAQALLRLIENPKLAKQLADQAYHDAKAFKEETFIKQLEKHLIL